MRHSLITDKNVTKKIVSLLPNTATPTLKIFKIQENTFSYEEVIPTEGFVYKDNNIWTMNILTPNEDCYCTVKLLDNNQVIDQFVIRVGNPKVKVFAYKDNSAVLNVKQFSLNGSQVDNANMIDLQDGFQFYEVQQIFSSIIEIDNNRDYLALPYAVISNNSSSSGVNSPANFLDSTTQYGTFGFIGEKNSYFDLSLGQWVNDANSVAKASDLIKAVCYKYNLEYSDISANNHVYKYIKYIQAYGEEIGSFLTYIPGLTPETDIMNFEMISTDELGNTYVRGIQAMLLQPLETTLDGSDGIVFPFTNDGM